MADGITVLAQATTGSSWVDSPGLRSVSESDAARLSDLLSTQSVQSQAPTALTSIAPPTGNTIGDAIIRSLEAAGRSYVDKSAGIHKLVSVENTAPISSKDLLRMQFELLDTSLQVDLISKVVSKGTQHIDQLTKLQ